MQYLALTIIIIFSYQGYAHLPTKPLNKEQEVIKALNQIYSNYPISFCCEQPISSLTKTELTNTFLSPKIRWSLIIPKKRLLKNRLCYEHEICINSKGERFKGINCCKETDPLYIMMVNDLHNRAPMIDEISKLVAKYKWGDIDSETEPEKISHLACSLTIDKKRKVIEPADRIKGIIARTYLYMHYTYQIPCTDEELTLFHQWDKTHTPSIWEKQKNNAITDIQGNSNPYIY